MMTARSALLVDCEDVAWFRDGPDGARGTAAKLGRRIGLGEQRTAELVLAVAELAANLTKHATDGSLLLRILRNHAALAGDVVAGVEVITVDSGPGMADVPAALRDGMSTTGTLGIGLGAVQRLADTFTIHSRPGTGTVQLARFWPHPVPPALSGEAAVGASPGRSAASRSAATPGPHASTPAPPLVSGRPWHGWRGPPMRARLSPRPRTGR